MTTGVLATHSLLLALPAVVPAFLLVGIIVVIAVRDRRRHGDCDDDTDEDDGIDTGSATIASDGPEKGNLDE
ncbi:hypothetical protein [Williamsia sterculiae]|uniref:Uncharacterized protein n=1 Tax=Williamsia sterculiae TaxID=1344003 RepID=A0A1N7FH76_9NOCA|nr:hypothetical protein [Williamsia sterculiae]SIR99586.1 hypothetical protein SAMN05445060_2061 [Williamsia sterculiae]